MNTRNILHNGLQIDTVNNLSQGISRPLVSKSRQPKDDYDDVDDLEDVRQIVQRMQYLQKHAKQRESMMQERDKIIRQGLEKDLQQELSINSIKPAETQGLARAVLADNILPSSTLSNNNARSVSPVVAHTKPSKVKPKQRKMKMDRQTSIHAMEILLKNIENLQHEQEVVEQMLLNNISDPNFEYKVLSPDVRENLRVLEEQIRNTIDPKPQKVRKKITKKGKNVQMGESQPLPNLELVVDPKGEGEEVHKLPRTTKKVRSVPPRLHLSRAKPDRLSPSIHSMPEKSESKNRTAVPSSQINLLFDNSNLQKNPNTFQSPFYLAHPFIFSQPHISKNTITRTSRTSSSSSLKVTNRDSVHESNFPPPPELLQSISESQYHVETPPALEPSMFPYLSPTANAETRLKPQKVPRNKKKLKVWTMDEMEALIQAHQNGEVIKTDSTFYNQFTNSYAH